MSPPSRAVTLRIDGQDCTAEAGTTILEAARAAGADIPTLCHLEGVLTPAACRVCLVEETRRGVLLASCSTPVAQGMDIRTDGKRVLLARRMVVELMLASHPDTCLVCDVHGRCRLRNLAGRLGIGILGIDRVPLEVRSEPAGEFIVRDLSKCILCGRCVSVCQNVVVQGAIDHAGRGFNTVVATAEDGPLRAPDCISCAVCIAMCPTGALDHRDRMLRREAPDGGVVVCQHCGCGCPIEVAVHGDRIVGRLPAADGDRPPRACSRGVYEKDFIKEGRRIEEPLLRLSGAARQASWDEAAGSVASSLGRIVESRGADSVAVWCSPLCSCEEGYLLQRFSREVLGSRLVFVTGSGLIRTTAPLFDSSAGVGYPSLCTIEDIERSDVIVVIGSDVSEQGPAVDFAVRRAVKFAGARMILIDEGRDNPMARWADVRISSGEAGISLVLAYLGEALLRMGTGGLDEPAPADGKEARPGAAATDLRFIGVGEEEAARAVEEILLARRLSIVLGLSGMSGLPAADMEEAGFIAQASWHHGRQRAGILPAGAFMNEIGLLRVGVCPVGHGIEQEQAPGPDRRGAAAAGCRTFVSSVEGIRDGKVRGLVLFGHDPQRFLAVRFGKTIEAMLADSLGALDCFLIVDARSRRLHEEASAILPLCGHEEREGTFFGVDGRRRVSRAAASPRFGSRCGVDILNMLFEAFGREAPGDLETIRREMRERGLW
jgi:formate dehydrogenase alpha subunit